MMAFYDSHLVLIQATLVGLVLALAVQVPMRMGVFSFAGAGSYGLGAYGTAELVIHRDLSALEAIVLAVLGTAFVGLLLGLLIHRLNGLYLAMATVAFDLIIGVVALNGGSFTGSSTGLYGVLTDFTMTQMALLTLVVLILVAWSERGRIGRRVQAVRDDPQLGASVGVPVRRYRLVAFVLSGALGGLAGSMNVLVRTTIGPLDIGFSLVVLALTMIIVGGAMSWKGALIGAVVFTWLPDLLTFVGKWQDLIYGILVALAAVFLPRGIHGLAVDVIRRIQRGRRDRSGTPATEVADDAGQDAVVDDAPSQKPVGHEHARLATSEVQR
jgi:branched-chain amino acid transport system permease protein